MAGVKGRSGTHKNKPWTEALRLATHRKEGDKAVLNAIAEACIAAAMAGDMVAVKEIGDRLDGKPVQETENTHRYEGLSNADVVERLRELRAAIEARSPRILGIIESHSGEGKPN